MPPVADSHYFPALDKCFAREARLISWNTVLRALIDESSAAYNTHLEHFFTDNETLSALSNAFDPIPKPSAKSASDFDAKTAPIHVSQALDGEYNLDELKKDAKWLSGEVQIEELAALRIAIVEWQERASDQLLLTAMNGPDGTLQALNSAGSHLAKSTFSGLVPASEHMSHPALDFSQNEVRQQRLLDVYLSEKCTLLKVVANFVSRAVVSKNELQPHHAGSRRENTKRTWIDSVASKVRQNVCGSDLSPENAIFTLNCIRRVSSILERVEDTNSWPKIFTTDPSRAQSYWSSQFSELVDILRLLLSNLYAFDGVPSAATVHAWFLIMNECAFLQEVRPYFPSMEAPQSLVAVISVEILKPQLVTGEIMRSASKETPGSVGNIYIKDDKCLKAVNEVLQACVDMQIRIASPAIFAWSIVTFVVRDIAIIHKEISEGRIEAPPDSPRETRRGSRGPRSDIGSLYLDTISVREWEHLPNGTPGVFAVVAVDQMNVFGLISNLSDFATVEYSCVADSDVAFICKEALLDLIREGIPFVQYDIPVMDAIMSILTPTELSLPSQKHASVLASKLLYDTEQLRPMIIEQALARYPYELSPLIRLFTTLTYAESTRHTANTFLELVRLLDNVHSYTQCVPVGFKDFQLINEELNENDMILTEPLPIFLPRRDAISSQSSRGQIGTGQEIILEQDAKVLVIAPGTHGRIVKESQPRVLKLEHSHSGLQYLGLSLSTFLPSSDLFISAPGADIDMSTAIEIVLLCTALLTAALKLPQGADQAHSVITSLSKALRDEQDIVFIITEIFETELSAQSEQKAQEGSRELVTACAEFLKALVGFSPERVWSHLARSSLLGLADGAPTLLSVVNGSEVQLGRYQFLNACVKLHASLMDDAVAGLVKRKGQSQRTGNRFAASVEPLDATSERIMSSVLNAYQKLLLDIFQHLPEVRFEIFQERCSINTGILETFTTLLRSTYGLSLSKTPSSRLTNVLAPAAASLLNACAPKSKQAPLVMTFVRLLSEALSLAEDSLSIQLRRLLVEQTKKAFQFISVLLRAASSGIDLLATKQDRTEGNSETEATSNGKSASTTLAASNNGQTALGSAILLSTDLLKSMPLFASLLASDHALKGDQYLLLTELVSIVGSSNNDPPSILAQLVPEAQQSLLKVVAQLDRPLCDVDVERQAWDFLSAVLRSRQQWFAVYLLTGELPRPRTQGPKTEAIKGKPILAHALDELSHISLLAPERAIGMLKFVATAQQTWAWATTTLRSHSDFIKNTLAWVDTLGPPSRDPSPGSSIICAKEYLMASLLCDIFAVNLHASIETGDRSLARSLSQKLSFLRDHGVSVNAYNRSLHRNLADNFTRRFPESELSDFQRTEVNPEMYGSEYLYDRDFATIVLGHDAAWYGPNRTRTQGFFDEFARANANLSLVNGQTKLLASWKMLATTLCECAEQDTALVADMAKVAEQCLLANVNPQLDEPGIADVLDTRIELAFVIVSRLVAMKVQDGAMNDLLAAAWELVRTSPVDYDVATVQADVRYYRKLLQVLYLTIQPHIYGQAKGQGQVGAGSEAPMEYLRPETASVLVSVVGKVICSGFRALCGNLHSDVELALPSDFALITALLQGILSVPGINSVYTLLSDIVAGSSIVRGALSLYSWADELAKVTARDPVYGETAVMFLLALSRVRPVAEQMALEGVLTNLSSSNLSNYLRKPGGKGPFDDPPRMFAIWSEGFLPLCLNLLDSVGPPIAGEVGAFLNSFPEQLQRAEKSLQVEAPTVRNPRAGSVTLGLVSEAHSLLMIAMILNSDIARGAAEGIDASDIAPLAYDFDAVKGLVEGLVRGKRSLNDRLVPANPLEEKWLKTQINLSGETLLKQKVLKELDTMGSYLGSMGS